MSMKRERWLRTSCPISDPAQTDVRRQYEAERQNVRLARFYERTEAWGCDSWNRMGDSARLTLEQLEGENRCLARSPVAVCCDGLGLTQISSV